MKREVVRIGIIGGSGFYDIAGSLKEIKVDTPYGSTSDKVVIGDIRGKKIAFLPRHNKTHDIPPHLINYRANIWALKSLGVERILTSSAVGSLQKDYKPGDFVILDQFVDRTKGRIDTFYDGSVVTHISTAFPYCPQISKLAFKKANEVGIKCHENGTVVVVQGPRFSTAAESWWFTQMGWHTINMTQYPEIALAREKEMCYTAIAIVTDYDSGLVAEGLAKPVSTKEISLVFKDNILKVKKLMLTMIENWPVKRSCNCGNSLENARF